MRSSTCGAVGHPSSWNLITYGLVFQTFTIKNLCSRFLRAFACQVFCKHDGVYDLLLLRSAWLLWESFVTAGHSVSCSDGRMCTSSSVIISGESWGIGSWAITLMAFNIWMRTSQSEDYLSDHDLVDVGTWENCCHGQQPCLLSCAVQCLNPWRVQSQKNIPI